MVHIGPRAGSRVPGKHRPVQSGAEQGLAGHAGDAALSSQALGMGWKEMRSTSPGDPGSCSVEDILSGLRKGCYSAPESGSGPFS